MSAEHPGASAAGVLPAGVTLTDVTWDDADGARLRAAQQAEIAVRYGSAADAATDDRSSDGAVTDDRSSDDRSSDGRSSDDAATATDAPGPTDEAAHGVDPATVVAAVLLRVDGVAVGFGALRDISGDDDPSGIVHGPGTAELKRLYVAPGHRGRGLSRVVLRALESRAAALGMRRVVLETGTQQPESMGLYLGEGYLPIEQYGEFWGEPDSRCFAKDLPLPVVVSRAAWDEPAARGLRVRFQAEEMDPRHPHVAEVVAAAGGFDAVDARLGERVVASVLAHRDGVAVGFGSLVRAPDDARGASDVLGAADPRGAADGSGTADRAVLEVHAVYVTPEARRWGVARAVMAELVTAARERDARRLVLVTSVRQPAAVTLHRSFGFRPVYPFGDHASSPTALFLALDL